MTIRLAGVLIAGVSICGAQYAVANDTPTGQEISKINAVLAVLKCQMDHEDIEKTASGFDLDDVYCSDGQYDITLDANFNVINKKAE